MTQLDLDAVIDELRKPDGWQKGMCGRFYEPDGSVCLLGAVARVLGLTSADDPYVLAADLPLVPVIREHFSDRVAFSSNTDVIEDFNDRNETTLGDVILVCEKARANR